MRFGFYSFVLMAVCAASFFCGTAWADAPAVEYKARIRGVSESALEKEIEETILTFRLKDRPPATLGQLRRRIDEDLPRIATILDSRGYYDGAVSTEIDTERDPVRVTFNVEPGEQYRFRTVQLRFYGSPDPDLQKIKPSLRKNSRVVASRVFEEQKRIVALLQGRGYPFPVLEKRTVTLDRATQTVDLLLEFNLGTASVYGDFEVEGLESVNRKYIKRQLPWKPGDSYDVKQLDDFENKLLRTGLFATARVAPKPVEDGTNAIPVKITVTERDKRTVRLGVNYSDVGFGAKVLWEHRNFFGSGEHLETSLTWSEIEVGGKISLTRPGFLGSNQSLVLDLDGSYETPDAYDSKKARATTMVLRDFTQEIQAGLGVGYQYSHVEQLTSDERYGLVFFPLQAVLDYRDDTLNPVRGVHVFGRTAYYQDTLASDSFLKSACEGRHYYTLWKRYRLSSALRLTLGSIDGTAVDNVPADERFYAGGGGSIRGYEYQAVGPSANGVPLGGDKLLEFSAEMRLQPGRRLGYVAFVDGGTVYNDLLPNADRSLRYGAGLGLRWFTGIGPLRLDVAYPLNPDATQSERVQFYISLGQAF
jgi:translocation and assembly module TamA